MSNKLRASESHAPTTLGRNEARDSAAPEPPLQDRLINTTEAASYLALAPSTLAKMRLDGFGPRYRKLGRRAVRYAILCIERSRAALSLACYCR
jgi:hypothetical protein